MFPFQKIGHLPPPYLFLCKEVQFCFLSNRQISPSCCFLQQPACGFWLGQASLHVCAQVCLEGIQVSGIRHLPCHPVCIFFPEPALQLARCQGGSWIWICHEGQDSTLHLRPLLSVLSLLSWYKDNISFQTQAFVRIL